MNRVRLSVRENRLTTTVLRDGEVEAAIEEPGRGWVMEWEQEVGAFAIANGASGHVWALFVDPEHEGQGAGGRLHDTMVAWLWSRDLTRLRLTTEPGTRAEGFYRHKGWVDRARNEHGEIVFELERH